MPVIEDIARVATCMHNNVLFGLAKSQKAVIGESACMWKGDSRVYKKGRLETEHIIRHLFIVLVGTNLQLIRMSNRGRKEDGIWQHFVKKKVTGKLGSRAICKKCGKEMQGLVDRLKNHWENCNKNENTENSNVAVATTLSQINEKDNLSFKEKESSASSSFSSACSGILSSFVVKTSSDKKHELDKQIAKAFFATNCSFRAIENKQTLKALQLLRPGYIPPSRFQLSTTLLDEIYNEEKTKGCEKLHGTSVCMSIDGWSNVHNEPIICSVLTTEDGHSLLLDTIDTSGHPHTAEYLSKIVTDLIKKYMNDYNCKVTSFVTDNAANMQKMKKMVTDAMEYPIITYGCSAHILNLLSKDLEITTIKEHIVQIVKYFRNTHLPNAWYKEKGGKKLVLPQDIRWNTLSDCLEIYVNEWSKLLQICEEHKDEIDNNIFQKVANIQIKRLAEDFLKILKPISVALDKLQHQDAFLSQAVFEWKKLEAAFDSLEDDTNIKQIKMFQKRYQQALTPFHFLAYLLDPTKDKTKFKLSSDEKKAALDAVSENFPGTGLLPLIVKLEAKSDPFNETMFSKEILENVNAVQWWRSQKAVDEINKVLDIVIPILCAVASSGCVERVFSSYGFIHSKIRNRLGTEKASKLVFLFKYYNDM